MGHHANRVPPEGAATAGGHPELGDAVKDVTAAVMAASRVFVAISARALADVDSSLTLVQLRTLVVLEGRGPLKLAALAGALGVNPSTAMRMVDRMEGVGLVHRQVNPGNRREVMLSLTQDGRQLVDRVMARRYDEMGALVARLPHGQRANLVRALHALTEAAGEPVTVDPLTYAALDGVLGSEPPA
jgi:DNA-binding MarR family transcriptional regulator